VHYTACDACGGTGKIDTNMAIPASEAREYDDEWL
jgi:hypothetical protein